MGPNPVNESENPEISQKFHGHFPAEPMPVQIDERQGFGQFRGGTHRTYTKR
jgi:hypothetical protein